MSRTITLAGYAVLAAALIALDVVARRTHRMATFTMARRSLLRLPTTRWLVSAGWLWLGWHMFARADWR